MCHDLLNEASLWRLLTEIDRQTAEAVRSKGCPCGGVLHMACYPRKPRGIARELLGPAYESRLSFCCARQGCRRRCTPPSVRYLGRRVYLGVIVTLACAIKHGLSASRRQYLINRLPINRHTLKRWLDWWRQQLPSSPFWLALRGQLALPIAQETLPGGLLGVLDGENLMTRLVRFLALLMPLTTACCPHCPRVDTDPQKMSV